MSATLSPLAQESDLKEYLIFRVDEDDDRCELADESALEGEAARYADFVAAVDNEPGIHYEVWSPATGGLLYSTEDHEAEIKEAPWRRTATS